MTAVLLGGGGVLGSGLREHLDRRSGGCCVRLRPPWGDPTAVATTLREQLPAAVDGEAPLLVWAAGAGRVGASREAMELENRAVGALCDAVRALPAEARLGLTLLFASSAGALFGGHGDAEVDEDSEPTPVTAYGSAKLAQEQALRRLAEEAGCRVLACRFSNLYGLAEGRLPARGFVPAAVRATRLRQPMTVFVSPDTRRDLLFHTDAAGAALRLTETAPAGFSTALVRDGATRTVSEILAVIGDVSRRRVPVTYAVRPETRVQPRVLRFARAAPGADPVRRTPMAAAVHRMLRAPMAP